MPENDIDFDVETILVSADFARFRLRLMQEKGYAMVSEFTGMMSTTTAERISEILKREYRITHVVEAGEVVPVDFLAHYWMSGRFNADH